MSQQGKLPAVTDLCLIRRCSQGKLPHQAQQAAEGSLQELCRLLGRREGHTRCIREKDIMRRLHLLQTSSSSNSLRHTFCFTDVRGTTKVVPAPQLGSARLTSP